MSDFQVGDDCDIDGCGYVYDEYQELFFHGYEHYGVAVPTSTPVLKFYRCEHDNFMQHELEGVIKQIRTDKSNVTESGLTGLHPYLVDSWRACQQVAPQIVSEIGDHMVNDRPDSDYMVVAPTNIRIYCFLVDLPVGHRASPGINKRPYIEDVFPLDGKDNLCLFRCIVKQLKPFESQEDRERRVNSFTTR